MNRQEAYKMLVEKRKGCGLCTQSGLANPASFESGIYDSDQIGPWSRWQGNLNAEIMVVGQDWGDINYFTKWEGYDQPTGNPTNTNLIQLLQQFGVGVKNPREAQEHLIFFTNMILCLKDGGMQASVEKAWFSNCSKSFFRQLVEIIQPKIILALGKPVSESILDLYEVSRFKADPLGKLMNSSPYKLTESTFLFPMYHCGARVVNTHRPMVKQLEDWRKAAEWFRTSKNGGESKETAYSGL
ncbi:MAG: uracil-DNA glycosylase family protein [Candidatus Cloacimonetes bacterium]|nr:uracil-DNA glycosylase family protein [Candidatus Cloacimonadota bacterium]